MSQEKDSNIELPSDKKQKEPKNKKSIKWIVIISLIILLYIFYTPLTILFQSFLEQNPTLHSQYLYIESQISNLTLIGLFFFSILGTLFFLILPSEATFIYYLSNTDHFAISIIAFALMGNMIGMSFNYFFGRILGQKILKFFFGMNEFYKYKDSIDRYGGYLLLLGNIIPGPIEFISVFFGGFKFSYKRYLYLVTMGRLIKYILLLLAFIFYWDTITYFYDGIMIFFKDLLGV